jgi:hypothetical protein
LPNTLLYRLMDPRPASPLCKRDLAIDTKPALHHDFTREQSRFDRSSPLVCMAVDIGADRKWRRLGVSTDFDPI